MINAHAKYNHTVDDNSMDNIEKFLEIEKQQNKMEGWLKLDKPTKLIKLHEFAETYGKDNELSHKFISALIKLFVHNLDNNKLNRSKDVIYNKTDGIISSIPALYFNTTSNCFSLKYTDNKRVSTLKSLTPKRITEKNRESIKIDESI